MRDFYDHNNLRCVDGGRVEAYNHEALIATRSNADLQQPNVPVFQ
jgi:hypothetical protein